MLPSAMSVFVLWVGPFLAAYTHAFLYSTVPFPTIDKSLELALSLHKLLQASFVPYNMEGNKSSVEHIFRALQILQ